MADPPLHRLQVNSIPFVSFDAGGVLELFDYSSYPQSIVWDATAAALASRLQEVLAAGRMQTVQLHPAFLAGRQRWLQWHADYAANMPALQQVGRPSCSWQQLAFVLL